MLYWIVPPPIQHPRMEFGVSGQIAAIGVDAESRRGASGRDRVTDLPRDSDGPKRGQRVRKVAQPFSEPQRRCVGVEWVGSNAFRARAAPLDAETDRHNELPLGVLDDPIFERRFQVLKSGCSQCIWPAGRAEAAIGRSKRNRERLGDPLGKFRGYIALPEGGIVAGLEIGYGRKRQLIVDAG